MENNNVGNVAQRRNHDNNSGATVPRRDENVPTRNNNIVENNMLNNELQERNENFANDLENGTRIFLEFQY